MTLGVAGDLSQSGDLVTEAEPMPEATEPGLLPDLDTEPAPKPDADADAEAKALAATRIQAAHRGKQGRRQVRGTKLERRREEVRVRAQKRRQALQEQCAEDQAHVESEAQQLEPEPEPEIEPQIEAAPDSEEAQEGGPEPEPDLSQLSAPLPPALRRPTHDWQEQLKAGTPSTVAAVDTAQQVAVGRAMRETSFSWEGRGKLGLGFTHADEGLPVRINQIVPGSRAEQMSADGLALGLALIAINGYRVYPAVNGGGGGGGDGNNSSVARSHTETIQLVRDAAQACASGSVQRITMVFADFECQPAAMPATVQLDVARGPAEECAELEMEEPSSPGADPLSGASPGRPAWAEAAAAADAAR
jgi:hypothetical protein